MSPTGIFRWLKGKALGVCSCGNYGPLYSDIEAVGGCTPVLRHVTIWNGRDNWRQVEVPIKTLCKECYERLRDTIRDRDLAAVAMDLNLPGEQESVDFMHAAFSSQRARSKGAT